MQSNKNYDKLDENKLIARSNYLFVERGSCLTVRWDGDDREGNLNGGLRGVSPRTLEIYDSQGDCRSNRLVIQLVTVFHCRKKCFLDAVV